MELATESMRRRWRHVDDKLAGGTLPLLEAAKGKAKASDTDLRKPWWPLWRHLCLCSKHLQSSKFIS